MAEDSVGDSVESPVEVPAEGLKDPVGDSAEGSVGAPVDPEAVDGSYDFVEDLVGSVGPVDGSGVPVNVEGWDDEVGILEVYDAGLEDVSVVVEEGRSPVEDDEHDAGVGDEQDEGGVGARIVVDVEHIVDVIVGLLHPLYEVG